MHCSDSTAIPLQFPCDCLQCRFIVKVINFTEKEELLMVVMFRLNREVVVVHLLENWEEEVSP